MGRRRGGGGRRRAQGPTSLAGRLIGLGCVVVLFLAVGSITVIGGGVAALTGGSSSSGASTETPAKSNPGSSNPGKGGRGGR